MSKLLGGCDEARAHFGVECKCCGSCHADFDCEDTSPDEIELADGGWFQVCCVVRLACKDKEAAREAAKPK